MFSVRRDVDEIARLHVDRLFVALEVQFGFALQPNNPFCIFLIVPRAIRTDLAGGDDPLDADVVVLGEDFNEFLWADRLARCRKCLRSRRATIIKSAQTASV